MADPLLTKPNTSTCQISDQMCLNAEEFCVDLSGMPDGLGGHQSKNPNIDSSLSCGFVDPDCYTLKTECYYTGDDKFICESKID